VWGGTFGDNYILGGCRSEVISAERSAVGGARGMPAVSAGSSAVSANAWLRPPLPLFSFPLVLLQERSTTDH